MVRAFATDVLRDVVTISFVGVLFVLTAFTAVRPVTWNATRRWLDRNRLPTTDAAVDEARPSLRRLRWTLAVGFLPALLAMPYSPVVLFAVPYLLDDRSRRRAAARVQPGQRTSGPLGRLEPRPLARHEWCAASLAVLGVLGASTVVIVVGFDAIAMFGYSALACGGVAALIMFGPAPTAAVAGEPVVATWVAKRLRLAAVGAAWYAVVVGLREAALAGADALGDGVAEGILNFLGAALLPVAVALLVGFAFVAPTVLVARERPADPSRLPLPPRF